MNYFSQQIYDTALSFYKDKISTSPLKYERLVCKKIHYIYEILDLSSGHFYIGRHSTDYLNDGYFGSGYALQERVNLYGYTNFRMVIHKQYEDFPSLCAAEAAFVNLDTLSDPLCLNRQCGGLSGSPSNHALAKRQRTMSTSEAKKKHRDGMLRFRSDPSNADIVESINNKVKAATSTPEYKKAMSDKLLRVWECENHRAKHSSACKQALDRPWVNGSASHSTYMVLDKIYEIWLRFDLNKWGHKTALWRSIKSELGLSVLIDSSRGVVRYFNTVGDPRLDDKWLTYVNSFSS